jgi:RHS repeat-associated protein
MKGGPPVQIVNNDSNDYKFTGKKQDIESGLDFFGARYYSNSFGRFVTADWSAGPASVPYARLDNPQTLNLYSYDDNNPVNGIDADGHAYESIVGEAGGWGVDTMMSSGAGETDAADQPIVTAGGYGIQQAQANNSSLPASSSDANHESRQEVQDSEKNKTKNFDVDITGEPTKCGGSEDAKLPTNTFRVQVTHNQFNDETVTDLKGSGTVPDPDFIGAKAPYVTLLNGGDLVPRPKGGPIANTDSARPNTGYIQYTATGAGTVNLHLSFMAHSKPTPLSREKSRAVEIERTVQINCYKNPSGPLGVN